MPLLVRVELVSPDKGVQIIREIRHRVCQLISNLKRLGDWCDELRIHLAFVLF